MERVVFEKMNKYEEAWNNVKSLSETSDYYKECDDEDIKLIQDLVEKEIPIKFVKSYSKHGTESWLCPNCGKSYEVDYEEYERCPHCGQMIDCGK